ncbi:MAG: aldo/keto reductase, partial [Rhodospirillaceae bacterium]
YLHRADPTTPLAETIDCMGDLIRAGKVRYWGFSNFRAWKIAEMVRLADDLGVPRPIVAQPYYNALYRVAEFEYLQACWEYGVGAVPYSPLARGVLTGKYGTSLAGIKGTTRAASEQTVYAEDLSTVDLAIAAKIKARAEKLGQEPGQFALNWVLNNKIVPSVIAGPRTLTHWKSYLGALKHPFTAEDEAFVEKLAPACYPLSVGYHEQKDPPKGRFPRTG